MFPTESKPIIHNTGAFSLQPRSISVLMVQTLMELDAQHIYALDAHDDLPFRSYSFSCLPHNLPKYPKLLSIPILSTAYDRVHISRTPVSATLNAFEIESTEVSNMSWTTTAKSQDSTKNSSTELPTILPESNIQPEHHVSKSP